MGYYTNKQIMDLAKGIISDLNDKVFFRIYDYVRKNPEQKNRINPAFPFPQQVDVNVIDGFLIIEYIGPEIDNDEKFSSKIYYQPNQSITDFFGIIKGNNTPLLPFINTFMSDVNYFLGNSIEYLCDYFYDFQSTHTDMVLNGMVDFSTINNPTVINNCTFFYTDLSSTLKIRHIDFMEIIPFSEQGISYYDDNGFQYLANFIINTTRPPYDIKLHKVLNDFIELISLENILEPEITSFIEKNPELLQLAFGFNKLNPQKLLIWQDRTGIPNLKPDFLPEDMSGYCNILDFKLPKLHSKPIVGTVNRQQPSYEIDSCVAQLEKYDEFCSQYVHQKWLLEEYKIKIDKPRKYIIMGHSSDFSAEDRQKLRASRDTTFFTYDEFIDMARYQLYRIH